MTKIKFDGLRLWISKKMSDISNSEDDGGVEHVYNQLKDEKVIKIE